MRRHRLASTLALVLLGGCASAPSPRSKEPDPVRFFHATYRGQLAAVRGCEEVGLYPKPEAVAASGANLAFAFARSLVLPKADNAATPPSVGPTWIVSGPIPVVAGYRAFRCPPAFLEAAERDLLLPARPGRIESGAR